MSKTSGGGRDGANRPPDAEFLDLIRSATRTAVRKGLVHNESDAESIADEAMTKALHGYDATKGAFNAYFFTIFLNDVRAHTPVVGIPSNAKRSARQLRQWHDFLMEALDRKPTYDELAKASGWPVKTVKRIVEHAAVLLESLSDTFEDGSPRFEPLNDERPVDDQLNERVLVKALLEAADRLPKREQTYIKLVTVGMEDDEIRAATGWSKVNLRQARLWAIRRLVVLLSRPTRRSSESGVRAAGWFL